MMPKNRRRPRRRNRQRNRSSLTNGLVGSGLGTSVVRTAIPSAIVIPVHQQVFKYTAQSETKGATPVTVASLCNLIWYATSTTTGRRLFGSVRLRRVRMYSISPGVDLNFMWLGFQGPSRTLTATSSDAQPAEIIAIPGADMFQSWWINPNQSMTANNNQDLFSATSDTTGVSYVEVEVQFTLNDNDNSNVPSNTLTTTAATLGQLYYNYLDNTASGSPSVGTSILVPSGYGSKQLAYGF